MIFLLVFSLLLPVYADDTIVFDDYVTEGEPSVSAEEAPEEETSASVPEAAEETAAGPEDGTEETETLLPEGDAAEAAAEEAAPASDAVFIKDPAEAEAENTDGDDTYVSNSGEVFQIPRIDNPEERVFDYAGLFSTGEENALRSRILEMQKKKKADIVILTSETVPEDYYYGTETTMKYAEQFLMDNGFREDALIFIIDMNNRVLWTAGHGKYAAEKYVKYEEKVYDAAMYNAKNGDYYGAANAFLDETHKLGNRLYAAKPTFLSLLFSVVLTLMSILGLEAKHSGAQPSKAHTPAVKTNGYKTLSHREQYLGTRRSVRHIPRRTESSGGGGGGFSGGSHSGGGFSGGGGGFSGGGGKF